MLTSIVRVLTAAVVPASLHCCLSAALCRRVTSQTGQTVKIQKGVMSRFTAAIKKTLGLVVKYHELLVQLITPLNTAPTSFFVVVFFKDMT